MQTNCVSFDWLKIKSSCQNPFFLDGARVTQHPPMHQSNRTRWLVSLVGWSSVFLKLSIFSLPTLFFFLFLQIYFVFLAFLHGFFLSLSFFFFLLLVFFFFFSLLLFLFCLYYFFLFLLAPLLFFSCCSFFSFFLFLFSFFLFAPLLSFFFLIFPYYCFFLSFFLLFFFGFIPCLSLSLSPCSFFFLFHVWWAF
jgi:hypothetical protein